MYAHTQTFLPKNHGRSIVQISYLGGQVRFYVNSALGNAAQTLAHMLDSLVRVSRRDDKKHFVRVAHAQDNNKAHADLYVFLPSTRKPNYLMSINEHEYTASHRFHFSNFRYSLTLFSKFFSSFPHGTCSLSVSHQYLALDGIYHPLRAAIPNNSTRRRSIVRFITSADGAITLHGAPFQETWRTDNSDLTSTDYNSED
jgi:hypothetical protein